MVKQFRPREPIGSAYFVISVTLWVTMYWFACMLLRAMPRSADIGCEGVGELLCRIRWKVDHHFEEVVIYVASILVSVLLTALVLKGSRLYAAAAVLFILVAWALSFLIYLGWSSGR